MFKYATPIDIDLLRQRAQTPGTPEYDAARRGELVDFGINPPPSVASRIYNKTKDVLGRIFTPSPGSAMIGPGGAPGAMPSRGFYSSDPYPSVLAPVAKEKPIVYYRDLFDNTSALAVGDQINSANAQALLQQPFVQTYDTSSPGDAVVQQLYANLQAQKDMKDWEALAKKNPSSADKILAGQEQYKKQQNMNKAFGEAIANSVDLSNDGPAYDPLGDFSAFNNIAPPNASPTTAAAPASEAATQNEEALQNIQDEPTEYVRNEDYPTVPTLPTYGSKPPAPAAYTGSPALPADVVNNAGNLAAQTATNNITAPQYKTPDTDEVSNNALALGQQAAASIPQTPQSSSMLSIPHEEFSFTPQAKPTLWNRATNYMSAHPLRTAGAAAALGALGLGALYYNSRNKKKKKRD